VLRIVDTLKQSGATGVFTSLSVEDDLQSTTLSISSLVDAWILLRHIEENGERNRVLYVLKSRGMAHSHQIREFFMTSQGVRLREVYVGPGGVLTGSSRIAREAEEQREEQRQQRESQQRELAVKAALRLLEAKISALQAEKIAQENELAMVIGEGEARKQDVLTSREAISRSRNMMLERTPKGQAPNGRGAKL
jgi:circadian clock protein KaiC